MKTLLITLLMALATITASAQAFKAPEKCKVDTTTTYTYEISKTVYRVYRSKSGAFYIWKTSKKTGNQYNKYLDEEISKKLCEEYNIKYTPKTTKK